MVFSSSDIAHWFSFLKNGAKKFLTLAGARNTLVFAVPPWFFDVSQRQALRVL